MKTKIKKAFDDAINYFNQEKGFEANKILIKEFPFLAVKDGTTKEIKYDWTELDCFEEGWRKAFGLSFCIELKEALEKDGVLDEFYFLDIKEKYASLRIYTNIVSKSTEKVLNKYEKLSMYICGKCGKPATYITDGYLYPLCDDCLKETELKGTPIEKCYRMDGKSSVEKITEILTKR